MLHLLYTSVCPSLHICVYIYMRVYLDSFQNWLKVSYGHNVTFALKHLTIQFSCLAMSDSLRPHGLHHAKIPCPSPTPGACKLMSIELVMPSNCLILFHPLLLLPSIFPSIRVFSNKSVLHIRWPESKYYMPSRHVFWLPYSGT